MHGSSYPFAAAAVPRGHPGSLDGWPVVVAAPTTVFGLHFAIRTLTTIPGAHLATWYPAMAYDQNPPVVLGVLQVDTSQRAGARCLCVNAYVSPCGNGVRATRGGGPWGHTHLHLQTHHHPMPCVSPHLSLLRSTRRRRGGKLNSKIWYEVVQREVPATAYRAMCA